MLYRIRTQQNKPTNCGPNEPQTRQKHGKGFPINTGTPTNLNVIRWDTLDDSDIPNKRGRERGDWNNKGLDQTLEEKIAKTDFCFAVKWAN